MTSIIANLLDTHKTYNIDFDVEGSQISKTALNTTRNAAIVALQNKYPSLSVSFTLPVMPTGLDSDGLNVLKSAIAAGVKVRTVNIMAMDYGDGSEKTHTMGDLAISGGNCHGSAAQDAVSVIVRRRPVEHDRRHADDRGE